MPEFTPHEPAPLNDTPESKGLADDPQLERVEEIEREALAQGLSLDEAQALAWARVEGGAPAPAGEKRADRSGDAATEPSKDGETKTGHSHPPDISVGG